MNSLLKKSVEVVFCCEKNKSFKLLNYACIQNSLTFNELIKKHYSTNNTLTSASKVSKAIESTTNSKTNSIFTSENEKKANKKADNISRAMSYYLEKLNEKGLQLKCFLDFDVIMF